jgi:K+-transporting ATPase ATPase A chain
VSFLWTLVALVARVVLSWRFLGPYMESVHSSRVSWLAWLEKPIYRPLRTHPDDEQRWTRYATSLIVFSGFSLLITYGILRLQGHRSDPLSNNSAMARCASWVFSNHRGSKSSAGS